MNLPDAERFLAEQQAYILADRGDYCLVYRAGYAREKRAHGLGAKDGISAALEAAAFLRLKVDEEAAQPPGPKISR